MLPREVPPHEAARLPCAAVWPPLPSALHAPLSGDASDPEATEDAASVPEPTPARPDRRPKLTAEDVRAIRADYAAGKWSQGDLAYIYGVTQSTSSAAMSGDTRDHRTHTPRTGFMRWREHRSE